MKHKLFILLICLSILAAPAAVYSAPAVPDDDAMLPTDAPYAPDQLIVKFRPEVRLEQNTLRTHVASLDHSLTRVNAKRLSRMHGAEGVYKLKVSQGTDIQQAVDILNADPAVDYAETDYLAHYASTPNDPRYGDQWGLTKVAVEDAWDQTTGESSVMIAVIDSGIDLTHEDLAPNLWFNPGEISGDGVDNDNNGFIDDVNGWNFVDSNNDVNDLVGHGTQVTGIAAAESNNELGIAGVCGDCKIMPVKVSQVSGFANYSDIAAGVYYAVQKGARVINISLGGYSNSTTLQNALDYARENNVVVVAGAGNDNSSDPFYPAAYEDVIAVGGTDQDDLKTDTSNYGTWVDLSVPGVDILSTNIPGSYEFVSGTSFAAPFVSGAAGLLLSLHPDWTPALVRSQFMHTADDITSLNPDYAGLLGAGRLNIGSSMQEPKPILTYEGYAGNGVPNLRPDFGSSVSLTVTIANTWADAVDVGGTLTTKDSYVTITSKAADFGIILAGESASNTSAFTFTIAAEADYNHSMPFRLTLKTADGSYSTTLDFTITTRSRVELVSGAINEDTTWTSDRIYQITNNTLVLEDVKLTIEPGTIVKFDEGKMLQISGELIADGEPDQEIIFTSSKENPTPGDWNIIKFSTESIDAIVDENYEYISGSIFRYVNVKYGRGIGLVDAIPYFSNVLFTNNTGNNEGVVTGCVDRPSALHWTGKNPRSGSLVLRDSKFIDNEYQGFATNQPAGNSAFFYVFNNIFYQNNGAAIAICNDYGGAHLESNFIENNGGGISLGNTGSNVKIINNFISGSKSPAYTAGFGVDIYQGSPIISNNTFANNGNGQVSCNGNCSVINVFSGGAPTVTQNTFIGNWLDSLIYLNYSGSGVYQYNNWTGNHVNHIFTLSNKSITNVVATNNYWGTTDNKTIDNMIYDFWDNFESGEVIYDPILTSPDQSAPPFLTGIDLYPDTVGIEQARFTLSFSKPMNTNTIPVVTFGDESPYLDFSVFENAEWLDDNHWTATYNITSLVPRGIKTVRVSNAIDFDGKEIPEDTRFGFEVDYASSINDQLPPNKPLVFASGFDFDTSSVEAIWWSLVSETTVTGYRYAIGTSPGSVDIINWTNINTNTIERKNLGLVPDQEYWLSVQSVNAGGLWSEVGSSAFISGQSVELPTSPLLTIFLPIITR